MMSLMSASAIASPNIAFIKYWGNRDDQLRLPSNGSISMNLDGLFTQTTVTFNPDLEKDTLVLNDQVADQQATSRVSHFLDLVRKLADVNLKAHVYSKNNFPIGAGIASSASAFAALSLAATAALGLELSEAELSRLARRGSGSACRSVPGGYVEWLAGQSDADSYAVSIASPDHWALGDCIAIVQVEHKPIGSSQGHLLANTSPLQHARVEDSPRRIRLCREAILRRDFEAFANITELDSTLMHAVMMTSDPPLFYWSPVTLEIMTTVTRWRREKALPVCYTVDAGPNVHVICEESSSEIIREKLLQIPGVLHVLSAKPAGPARLCQT
ncbi:MAG: diphosphomevalonate decarboxylase [Anaerolineales bacterium]